MIIPKRSILLMMSFFAFLINIGRSGAFAVEPKYINLANQFSIDIKLDGHESAIFASTSPYIRLGDSVRGCRSEFGALSIWRCDLPASDAYGVQPIYLLFSENGPIVSKTMTTVLDKSAVFIVKSTPFTQKGVKILGDYKNIPEEALKQRFKEGEIENLASILIDNNSVGQSILKSNTYSPKSALMYVNDFGAPEVCKSAMTKVDVSNIISAVSNIEPSFESITSATPTKEPAIGNQEFLTEKIFLPNVLGDARNRYFLDALKTPIGNVDPYIKDFLEKSGYRYEPRRDNRTKVYVLDTYDSASNIDTYEHNGIKSHGKIIYEIIKSIGNLDSEEIIGLNVCESKNGDCDIRLIIDGICQAAYEAHFRYRDVLVNLSFTSNLGGSDLFNVIKFAMNRGVTFIVSNGNRDRCKEYRGLQYCNQYPADWSHEFSYLGLDGQIISVGSVEPTDNTLDYNQFSSFDRRMGKYANANLYATIYFPGEYYAAFNENTKIKRSGTSFSAPYVTGVLALWQNLGNGSRQLPCRLGRASPILGIMSLEYPQGSFGYDCGPTNEF